MNGVSGPQPHVAEGVGTAPTRDTPRRAWGLIGGIAPVGTSGTSRRPVMVGLCRGWCFSCSTDKNLSRMGLGFPNKSPREFYVRWLLMKFTPNDFWTLRLIGKNHNLKERLRGSMGGL